MSLNFLHSVLDGAAEDYVAGAAAGAAAAGAGAAAAARGASRSDYGPSGNPFVKPTVGDTAAPMSFEPMTITVKTAKPIEMSTGAKVALGVGAAIAAYLLLAD